MLIELFTALYTLRDKTIFFPVEFNSDVEIYLTYLFTNNSIYCFKEQGKKRTPGMMKLKALTVVSLQSIFVLIDSLNRILNAHGYTDTELYQIIFDETYEPVLTVDGSIESSGGNFYEKGFTEEMYNSLSTEDKAALNRYGKLPTDDSEPHMVNYSELFGEELNFAIIWLQNAYNHVSEFPDLFDEHLRASILSMIKYLETGDEEEFRNHCREWIKQCATSGKVDYTMGFIEQYHDPKGVRGHAGADVLIKTVDISRLTPMLLDIEQRAMIPDEYKKRREDAKVLNVSINKSMFGAGDYGPLSWSAAYCLPNYGDLRADCGSKQIIYKSEPNMADELNPGMSHRLKPQHVLDLAKSLQMEVSQMDRMNEHMWNLQVLLHETIGHGSGKAFMHTFTKDMVIDGVNYTKGMTVPLTETIYNQVIGRDASSLEELRADINALVISFTEIEELNKNGCLTDDNRVNWLEVLELDGFRGICIEHMCTTYLRRISAQPKDFKGITGAHSRCNGVITNTLLESGSVIMTEDVVNINNENYTVYGFKVIDLELAMTTAIHLMQYVQHIKSTANGDLCDELFAKYTTTPITIEKANRIREDGVRNRELVIGGILSVTRIYPNYKPVCDVETGQIVDVVVGKKQKFLEQNIEYNKIMLSHRY
jgi:hypothetical protein